MATSINFHFLVRGCDISFLSDGEFVDVFNPVSQSGQVWSGIRLKLAVCFALKRTIVQLVLLSIYIGSRFQGPE
jgi:hypothetical protein